MPPSSHTSDSTSPPKTPASSLRPGLKISTVKTIAEKYERPQLQFPDAEPSKPLRDLKEEYKHPWKGQRREEVLRERVRKGDRGLDPFLRERAREEEVTERGHGEEVEGARSRVEGEERDALTQLQLQLQLQLPQQATLHLLRAQSTILPLHMTPLAYAVDPWLLDNPEYQHYLDPTTPSSTSQSSLPAQASSMYSGEVSARTDEAFPEIPFESIAVYLRDRDELQVRLQLLQVRMLLQQCAVLVRSAWTLEQAEWRFSTPARWRGFDDEPGRMGQAWYKTYSKAGHAAEKAGQMAKALGLDGLQARTWYWKGQADAGRRFWDEAGAAFRRAEQFDLERGVAGTVEEYGKMGLTPVERRDVGWLRRKCEEKDELVQRRRHERARSRAGGEVVCEETEDEDEKEEKKRREVGEEPVDLDVLRVAVYGEIEAGKPVDDATKQLAKKFKDEMRLKATSVARRQNKTRLEFESFSKEEEEYIMDGGHLPEMKQGEDMESEGPEDDYGEWNEGGWMNVSPAEDHAVSVERES